MKMRIEQSAQVLAFIRSLSPEPRKAMRAALHKLEKSEGEVKVLEGELAGYSRLRVGSFRIIFRIATEHGIAVAKCAFAERRALVYELFAHELRRAMEKSVSESDD